MRTERSEEQSERGVSIESRTGIFTHPPPKCHIFFKGNTPEKSNIAPENGWLEDHFPSGKAYFQVRTVSFREGKLKEGLCRNSPLGISWDIIFLLQKFPEKN